MMKCHSQQGTASVGEYILTFSLVVAVIAGMSTYYQRSLQGRMRDARHYMAENLREQCNATNCVGKNEIGEGYEPYYTVINSQVASDSESYKGLASSKYDPTGVFLGNSNSKNQSNSQGQQLPPKEALNDKVLGSQ